MKNIASIAKSSFLNLLADKVFWLLVIFPLLGILSTNFLANSSLGQEQRVLLDIGFACLYVFSLFGAVILPFRLEEIGSTSGNKLGNLIGLFLALLLLSLICLATLYGFLSNKGNISSSLFVNSGLALLESFFLAALSLLVAAKTMALLYIKRIGIAILLSCLLLILVSVSISLETKNNLNKNVKIVFTKADLGINNAIADAFWLKGIEYYGEKRDNYDLLHDYLEMAIKFDPYFSEAYSFGVINLPNLGYSKEGMQLGEKAIKNGINDWRIPFYLAANYYINSDKEKALYYFDLAVNSKNIPDNIKNGLDVEGLRKSLVK